MQAIGRFVKTKGFDGALIIEPFVEDHIDISEWKAIMVELNPESYIPYFLTNWKQSQHEISCNLRSITDRDSAKLLMNKKVYPPPGFELNEDAQGAYADLIGFHIIADKKDLGPIHAVADETANVLFVLASEALIPAHESLIEDIDTKKKIIYMKLPEGLIDAI